jgi:hypothetical protein
MGHLVNLSILEIVLGVYKHRYCHFRVWTPKFEIRIAAATKTHKPQNIHTLHSFIPHSNFIFISLHSIEIKNQKPHPHFSL